MVHPHTLVTTTANPPNLDGGIDLLRMLIASSQGNNRLITPLESSRTQSEMSPSQRRSVPWRLGLLSRLNPINRVSVQSHWCVDWIPTRLQCPAVKECSSWGGGGLRGGWGRAPGWVGWWSTMDRLLWLTPNATGSHITCLCLAYQWHSCWWYQEASLF